MKNARKYNFVYRNAVILGMTIKFIIQLYLFTFTHRIWDDRTVRQWNRMLARMAREFREKAVRLGGVLIKVGQFLSTRADFLPEAFIRELSGLADQVPAVPFDISKGLLEEEWNSSMDKHLERIDPEPVASASIGEVYRAVLKDGTKVAVKVQRYRVREIFRKDFVALKLVFWLIRVFTSFGKKADLTALYKELVRVMDRELDFRQELKYGNYFKERYRNMPSIHIPSYYNHLCTSRVLVMDWVDGAKITDVPYLNAHHLNPEHLARTLFDFYIDQFLHPGYFHADPHAGNILVQEDGAIAILDFGMVGEISKQDTVYFKRVARGFIIDDYKLMIDALEEMDFLLPEADKAKLEKAFRQLLDLYQDGSLKDMDTDTMAQIAEEVKIIVQEQPIQLPADYAYFARAVSIIAGLLYAVFPEMDIEKWAKPQVKKWFGYRNLAEAVAKQKAKEAAEPVLALPRAMLKWLENGEKDREWDKEKQELRLKHHFYLFLETICFIMVLIGAGMIFYGYTAGLTGIAVVSLAVTSILVLLIHILFYRHYRMIQFRKRGGVANE
ncbi:ABC1 kinase family protein [Virgibacillus xinjiangensis]|uniref:ABC1 kinase family protein n=1 Tax=Virgibacillus xinjiangensis TaxID=393090 RepID=A0ABV7CQU2_9BACI